MKKEDVDKIEEKLAKSIEETNKLKEELQALKAVDKYLEITEFENNSLIGAKKVEYNDTPMGDKCVVIAFKLNNKDYRFTFRYREGYTMHGSDFMEKVRNDFSVDFSRFIYNLMFKNS